MNKETLACLGFSMIKEVGPMRFVELLANYKSAYQAYIAPEQCLAKIVGSCASEKIIQQRTINLGKYLINLQAQGINYVGFFDKEYPYLLKQIIDPPIGLFYRGNLKTFNWQKNRFLAIVGTRYPGQYGKKITSEWASMLCRQNIILVSGLAKGIDTLVHQAVVENKGKTIAVLGNDISYVYPTFNQELSKQIVRFGGLIVSEFAPQTKITKSMFTSRNRIISGLCRATLIIEGTKRSGTLITAKYSLNQGREVLVLPGEINRPNSEAGLIMLKNGAIPVSSVKEVMEAV